MIFRFFRYAKRVFHLHRLLPELEDGRSQPQIAGTSIWFSMFLLFFLRLGSLNVLEEILRDPSFRRKWASLLGDRPSSADTIGYFAERIDCNSLRSIIHVIYNRLQRNRHIPKFRFGGWTTLALDGHELFSSYDIHCKNCRTRTVKTRNGEVTQYYHSIVAAHLVGGPIPILLDVEEIRPAEDEIEAAKRLLERVQTHYPKAYDVVTGDAIYADPRIVSFLRAHKKHLVAVLKEDNPGLLKEARSLSNGVDPIKLQKEENKYLWWDITGIPASLSAKELLRVVRSTETKPKEDKIVTSDWFWVTTFSPEEADTATVWRIGHSRWEIENHTFNYLATYLNIDRVFRHDQNAILAFVLTAFIVHMIVCAFHKFSLKPESQSFCCLSTLAHKFRLTLGEFLGSLGKTTQYWNPG